MTTTIKPDYLDFAERLRTAMNRAGFTQSELAARANTFAPKTHQLSRSNISEYCLGKKKPGAARLDAVCRALNIPVSDLISSHAPTTRKPLPSSSGILDISVSADRRARLQIDRILPWNIATQIVDLINSAEEDPSD